MARGFCQPKTDQREMETRAVIIGGMTRHGLNREMLAKKVKRKPSTLNTHIREIRAMRLGELWDILDVLQPDEAEIMKILITGGRGK